MSIRAYAESNAWEARIAQVVGVFDRLLGYGVRRTQDQAVVEVTRIAGRTAPVETRLAAAVEERTMLTSVARLALDVALPGGAEARLSVLGYHRVLPAHDPLLPSDPTVDEFERTMQWVKATFNVIPLADGVAGLRTGKLPRRALAISFDDGYANNATLAAPVLARLGLQATFFIATGYLDGGRMFNDTVVEAVRAARAASSISNRSGLGTHPVGLERRAADGPSRTSSRAIKYRLGGGTHGDQRTDRGTRRRGPARTT